MAGGKEIEWKDNCRSLKTEKIKGNTGLELEGKMDNSFYVRAGVSHSTDIGEDSEVSKFLAFGILKAFLSNSISLLIICGRDLKTAKVF